MPASSSRVIAQTRPVTAPELLHVESVDDVIRILREPAQGDRSAELFRKRRACAWIRADFKDASKAAPDLIRLLADDGAALPAMEALRRIAPEVRDQLVAAAHDPQASVRFGAVQALVPLGKEAELLMIDLSRNDPDSVVRRVATYALCDIGSTEASPTLVLLLKDKDMTIRLATLRAMQSWPLTKNAAIGVAQNVSSQSVEIRAAAVDLLVRDQNHYPDVLSWLGWGSYGANRPGEYESLEVVAVYPRTFWTKAFSYLQSQDGRTQNLACDLVGRMGPHAIQFLRPLAQLSSNRWGQNRGNIHQAYESVCRSLEGAAKPTKTALEGIEPATLLQELISIVNDPQVDAGVKIIALGPLQRFGDQARPAIAPAAALFSSDISDSDKSHLLDFLSHYAPVGYAADQGAIRSLQGQSSELRISAEHYLALAGTSVYPQLLQLLHGSPAEAFSAIHVMQTLPMPDPVLAQGLAGEISQGQPDARREAIALLETWLSSGSANQSHPLIDCRKQMKSLCEDPDPVVRDHAIAILKLQNTALAGSAATPAVLPPVTAVATQQIPVAWSRVFAIVLMVFVIVLVTGWIAVHLLARQAQRHLDDSTKITCQRCQAMIPPKSRFCSRCGLGVANTA